MTDKEQFKQDVLQLIKDKLKRIKNDPKRIPLIVDRIDEVVLKELHNDILLLL